ncbi:centrosomal protein of 70 kDa-like [Oncorhynchus mykiss]|uniref:centrosomal protein of 70 kDa-like n=1 Tax=Oncorhynchus mykiss TaxID=8022 RepID=UPI0018785C5C|nr:centrosomal protein of 70 kDa-like [Oncorhynchus mykiss]
MDRENTNAVFHSRDKTYVFLWTYSQFQQEQTEWDAVNRLLQHHGFKPVHFADPVANKNHADLVLLEKMSACDIRTMLRAMLTDREETCCGRCLQTERRQTLIQELIESNNQLKEEAQQHVSRAARQSQRVNELEGVLDGVKNKLQDLEDSYIGKATQQHSKVHHLQQDKRDAQKRCQGLEQKLSEEKDVVSQLQRKLYFTVTEEERRVARQNQVFWQIHKRSARPNSLVDQQVLDVIDIYEAQMEQLCDDSYQEQLMDTKAQREELRNEIQQLKQDLESRPTVKELKSYKEQLRRMDRLIHQSAQEFKEEGRAALSNQEVAKARALAARHEKVLNDIRAVLTTSGAPLRLHRARPSTSHPLSNRASEMVEFDELLSTLEMWADQLASLKRPKYLLVSLSLCALDLHCGLSKLMLRLVPWQPAGATSLMESVRVEDLMLLVDSLLEETNSGEDTVLRSPTRNTLQSMVSHFQKLFDITSLSGVYPRMNEVYTRLGEMTNAMRNLRDILALDHRAPLSEVVNQIASLVNSPEATSGHEPHVLLGTSDIDSIILKVKEHAVFFPAFYFLVQELLQTLDVDRLDDIMPVLRSLKSRAE